VEDYTVVVTTLGEGFEVLAGLWDVRGILRKWIGFDILWVHDHGRAQLQWAPKYAVSTTGYRKVEGNKPHHCGLQRNISRHNMSPTSTLLVPFCNKSPLMSLK